MQSFSEKRRFRRYEVSIPVELVSRHGNTEMLTNDISRHGAFLRTDNPASERQLVKLLFKLPGGAVVEVMGSVSYVAYPEDRSKQGPGMGIKFFSIPSDAKEIWDRFCLSLENGVKIKAAQLKPLETSEEDKPELHDAPEVPIRRHAPRIRTSFLVRLRDRERMRDFYTHDISTGGMFLKTPLLKEHGEDLDIVLIHPETKEEFPLEARVVRVVNSMNREQKGMAVEFLDVSEEKKKSLREFETGANFLTPQ